MRENKEIIQAQMEIVYSAWNCTYISLFFLYIVSYDPYEVWGLLSRLIL